MDSRVRGEDVETFSKDTFVFGEDRIVCSNKAAGVEVIDGLMVEWGWRAWELCLVTKDWR